MTGNRILALAASALLLPSVASAREHRVDMVNRSAEGSMAFAPGFVRIAPGDTVRFVPKDKSHNAESLPLLTPKGAAGFKGAINQELVVRFDKPGLYGYKCLPHLFMGMVGLIQVGAPANRAAVAAEIQKLPPVARKRMTAYLAQVK